MSNAASSRSRDYRLDFFRGLALFLIFIDHVPDNVLGWFTLPSVAFCDAAEIFFFISGYVAALVYGGSAGGNPLFAVARIYKRVWQLYVAHLFLFMLYNAEVSFTVHRFNNPMYNDELHVADFLDTPDTAILNVLLLRFQPAFLDILPIYILMLALFPIVLMALRRGPWLVLAPSLALYVAVQIWGFNAPGYPDDRTWFFDPYAWQFPFVLGAVFGAATRRGTIIVRNEPSLTIAAGAVALILGVIKLSWTIHGLVDDVPGILLGTLWPVDKTTLAPIRMVNFLALAVLARALIRPHAHWLRSRLAWPIVMCGQNSLEIFCAGILLALIGHVVMVEFSDAVATQIAINLGAFAIMLALAYLLSWYSHGGVLPPRPALPPEGEAR